MATIRKSGIDFHLRVRDHIGEDRSFGRASLLPTKTRSAGPNPDNAMAELDEDAVGSDQGFAQKALSHVGHKSH